MESTARTAMTDEMTPEALSEMEEYGITRFPIFYFQFRQYKYSNLKDAVAQAKRERGGT